MLLPPGAMNDWCVTTPVTCCACDMTVELGIVCWDGVKQCVVKCPWPLRHVSLHEAAAEWKTFLVLTMNVCHNSFKNPKLVRTWDHAWLKYWILQTRVYRMIGGLARREHFSTQINSCAELFEPRNIRKEAMILSLFFILFYFNYWEDLFAASWPSLLVHGVGFEHDKSTKFTLQLSVFKWEVDIILMGIPLVDYH